MDAVATDVLERLPGNRPAGTDTSVRQCSHCPAPLLPLPEGSSLHGSLKLEDSCSLLLCLHLLGVCILLSLLAGWVLALSFLPRASFAHSPAFIPKEEPPASASPVSSENGATETAASPLRPCSYRVRSGSCIHLSAKEMHRTCHCFLNVKVSLPCFSY